MTTIHAISGTMDDQRRRELIYGGDLIVYKDVPATHELVAATDQLIREALDLPDPTLAHQQLDPAALAARLGPLQQRYRRHEEATALMRTALRQVGVPMEPTYWDWLYLRALPDSSGGGAASDQRTAPLGWHRDTWSSNVYAQSNWWAPFYAITAGRTISFHPAHWSTPIANTSADWELEDVVARRRRGETVTLVPAPSEPVDTAGEVRVVLEPGDLLCFSGAHLHASVPNHSGRTRFSVEVRTVDGRDVTAGRGAPNVDGAAPHVALRWFRGVEDGRALTEEISGASS